MTQTTISALTAVLAGNLDDTAVVVVDDKNQATRKATLAQLRTQIAADLTTASALTTIGTLVAGAVPASLVTAGTFGAGAYTFPGALTVTGLTVYGVNNLVLSDATQPGMFLNYTGATPFSALWYNDGVDISLYDSTNARSPFLYNSATNVVALSAASVVVGTDPGGTQLLRVGGSGGFSGLLTASAGLTIASGQDLTLGRAYSAGVVTATGTIALKDSTGTVYNVLVHT